MKQTLLDFGVKLDRIPLLCENESAVKIAKNPVQHSRTKHIDIRHHFLRDHEAKGDSSRDLQPICVKSFVNRLHLVLQISKILSQKKFAFQLNRA